MVQEKNRQPFSKISRNRRKKIFRHNTPFLCRFWTFQGRFSFGKKWKKSEIFEKYLQNSSFCEFLLNESEISKNKPGFRGPAEFAGPKFFTKLPSKISRDRRNSPHLATLFLNKIESRFKTQDWPKERWIRGWLCCSFIDDFVESHDKKFCFSLVFPSGSDLLRNLAQRCFSSQFGVHMVLAVRSWERRETRHLSPNISVLFRFRLVNSKLESQKWKSKQNAFE